MLSGSREALEALTNSGSVGHVSRVLWKGGFVSHAPRALETLETGDIYVFIDD